ncbi:MAG: tetratricopeptide repeat protein [Bacteroidia bacterium]|jgi:tetratricopeptide (TPR) repeat protein|nr:tetratricopeptide repeat protein [Bacteroidia bacterium]
MFKPLAALFVGLLLVTGLSAQYAAADVKKIEKSKEYFKKAKYDKAVSTLAKVQANPSYYYDNSIWDLRVLYEYFRYKTQYQTDMKELIRKINSPKTYTVDLNKLKFVQYKMEMIGQCKLATLFCEKQSLASSILFDELISTSTDTAVSDEAKTAYRQGDEEYSQENWSAAIKQYQKALREDSTYYNATVSIGMAYEEMEEWEKAASWYEKSKRMQPGRLKPYSGMVKAYSKLKRWDDAYNACVDGIIAYPDNSLFEELANICEKQGKSFNRHWMSRTILPNRMSTNQDPAQKDPWTYYRTAKDKIVDNCNDDGVINRESELTNQKYMEVYSWEYMLKKDDTDEKEFGFARKMEKEGFLDCFVFVSMYHVNFREQYTDFSKNNAERIRTYISTQLVK